MAGMEFEWDPAKDAANVAKHGISLAEAKRLDWKRSIELPDLRNAYGESRFIAYAVIGSRLFACVYAQRGLRRRIISLRKANKREISRYGLP